MSTEVDPQDAKMEEDQPAKRDWIFRGFMIGAVGGAILGLIVFETGRRWGKAYPEVFAGFWGLIGGAVGLLTGIVHRLFNRK